MKRGSQRRALAVVTSASNYRDAGYRTGLWLSELTHFCDVMAEANVVVDIVSVLGGEVPIDPVSVSSGVLALTGAGKRYRSRAFMDELLDTRSIDDVVPEDYDAIYLAGGHGAMFDFTVDERLHRLVADVAERGGVVSAVCHGVCGLLEVEVDGRPLLAGRNVTGYSWAEEKMARRADVVPYNLEERLGEKAGAYTKAKLPMTEHVVVDGRLVTGQNPMSAKGVAKAVLELV